MAALNEDAFYLAIRAIYALVALSIAVLALRGYVRFQSWRLFFLAAAFLILSISPLLDVVRLIGSYTGLSQWDLDALEFASYLFILSYVVAFFLIAYVYWDERRNNSIFFTRAQAWVGCGVLLVEFLFFLWVTWVPLSEGLLYSLQLFFYLLLASTVVSHLLVLFIVISLYSYYRAKRTENTLLTLIGFSLILLTQSFRLIYGTYHYSVGDPLSLYMIAPIELCGYLLFLVGLLRLGRAR